MDFLVATRKQVRAIFVSAAMGGNVPVQERPMDFSVRARNIILQPQTEWPVVSREKTDSALRVASYILVFVGLQSLSLMLCLLIAGDFGSSIGLGVIVAVGISGFTLALLFTFMFALLANLLARMFGGEGSFRCSLQLVAYASTPSWIGGAFGMIPVVGSAVSVLAGVYGLYVLCVGVPPMMKIPKTRTLPFTLILVFSAMVLAIMIGAIQLAIGNVGNTGNIGATRIQPQDFAKRFMVCAAQPPTMKNRS
ncbi:MAG: Yip1 family protein [Betaproteobacteria bacterium]